MTVAKIDSEVAVLAAIFGFTLVLRHVPAALYAQVLPKELSRALYSVPDAHNRNSCARPGKATPAELTHN